MTETTLETLQPEILNPDARGDLIILCDHATNHVPPVFDDLGLDEVSLGDHIAVDIGAAEVTRLMAEMMGISAVLAPVSRLVIDVNRDLGHAGLIPVISDGIQIPGNRALTAADTEARVKAYYEPFHAAANDLVDAHLEAGKSPFIIGMHSFTPTMNGEDRPWHSGFLWNKDHRLAQAMIGILECETDMVIGDNKPYSGKDLFHTMEIHGAQKGLPAVTVEVRNDLLCNPDHYMQWARLFANTLDELFGREDLARREPAR